MDNVTIINTPLAMQAAFKLLKADVAVFTKRLEAHSDLIQKMNKWVDSVKILEKAQAKEARRKLKQAQVNSLGNDLSKFDRGMTKRHRPSGK